jgi:hypothetical protein
MTNLEIIKYLATNNPTRLAELLKDIYFSGFTSGIWEKLEDVPDFKDRICADPTGCALYDNEELEEWSKVINSPPTITAYYDGLSVTFPVKDPDHMWNNNNEYDYEETSQ